MTPNESKSHPVRSACALALAAITVFGSVFTVAAAATAPEEVLTKQQPAKESSAYTYLTEGGSFHVLSANEVTVVSGENTVKVLSSGGTVAEALKTAKVTLAEGQMTIPAADTVIKSDLTITVCDAKTVSVTADGETKDYQLPFGPVEKSLKLIGFQLGKDDILSVERNEAVENIDKLTVQRVVYKDETTTESVAYDSVKENSDQVDLGETKLKTKGVNGEKAVVSRVKYVDGKRDSAEKIAEKLIKKPVDEVTLVGTKGAGTAGGAGTFTDSNGVKVAYKYMLSGSGTAYTAPAGALTATGNPAHFGGVAINPELIPYGSKLYVESVDGSFVYGYCTAIDTGGALEDGSAIVDCFYDTYDECVNFGRRDINVYVIE